jgi:hypothetical protein
MNHNSYCLRPDGHSTAFCPVREREVMSSPTGTVNEGTRLTSSRILKLIPGLADWAVTSLLNDIKANGGRNVNGVHVHYMPNMSSLCNTQGLFVVGEYQA